MLELRERETQTLFRHSFFASISFHFFSSFLSISDACLVFSLSPYCSFFPSCCCCCLFFFCLVFFLYSFLLGCFLCYLSFVYVLTFFSYYYVLLDNRLLLLCCYWFSPPPSPEKKGILIKKHFQVCSSAGSGGGGFGGGTPPFSLPPSLPCFRAQMPVSSAIVFFDPSFLPSFPPSLPPSGLQIDIHPPI